MILSKLKNLIALVKTTRKFAIEDHAFGVITITMSRLKHGRGYGVRMEPHDNFSCRNFDFTKKKEAIEYYEVLVKEFRATVRARNGFAFILGYGLPRKGK